MKPISTCFYYKKSVIVCSLIILSASYISCTVTGNNVPDTAFAAKKEKDLPGRKNTSYKVRSVKIYPDAFHRFMHVKNLMEKPLEFFVFDHAGTMMIHFRMVEKEHKKITGLERSTYIYQVFEQDEMIESGKMTIK